MRKQSNHWEEKKARMNVSISIFTSFRPVGPMSKTSPLSDDPAETLPWLRMTHLENLFLHFEISLTLRFFCFPGEIFLLLSKVI